jgi:hypothetical protein
MMDLDDVELSLIPMLTASYFNNDPRVGEDSTIDDRILQLATKAVAEMKKRIEDKQKG